MKKFHNTGTIPGKGHKIKPALRL